MKPLSESSRRSIQWTLTGLAGVALLGGLAVALTALAAPLGVWFGLWDFRRGFSLLRTANEWGTWVALSALVLALVVFVVAKYFQAQHEYRLGLLSLIGCLAAALAYYVPETYRPPEGATIPPIHDISTDTDNPPQFVDVLPLRADAPNAVEYGSGADMTPERLAQLQKEAYPDIAPLRTSAPKQQVFELALVTAEELGWELVSQDPQAGRIEATDTTFWFRFKDDVVIAIESADGETVVNARSVSRVGRSDVGKNAARLRAFFEVLKQKLDAA